MLTVVVFARVGTGVGNVEACTDVVGVGVETGGGGGGGGSFGLSIKNNTKLITYLHNDNVLSTYTFFLRSRSRFKGGEVICVIKLDH